MQALDRWEASLAQFQDLNLTIAVGWTLVNLGTVARAQGDNSRAAQCFAEGLALLREYRFGGNIAHDGEIGGSLEGLAGVAGLQEQPERAARLFGAAEALRLVAGKPLPPAYRAAYECDVAAARAQLGEATFAAAWAAGQAMTIDEAITYALSEEP
jgi:hypothetical protein